MIQTDLRLISASPAAIASVPEELRDQFRAAHGNFEMEFNHYETVPAHIA